MTIIPANEVITNALRQEYPMFPKLAVRELVANSIIHQDFIVSGAGPLVEIFENRLEVSNPGEPLADVERFLDSSPRSRNEKFASMMRRLNICEERGSGIDKVVFQIELYQLPAPKFESVNNATIATIYAHKNLKDMNREERIRATYLHACLKKVMDEYLTNTLLRERLGIQEQNRATVSRYIKESVDAGKIKPVVDNSSKRLMRYVPYWG